MELEAFGAALPSSKMVELPGFTQFRLRTRLLENEAIILDAFRSTVAASDRGEAITPTSEWLLNNHYLIEENVREVRRALPPRFYRELPLMNNAGTDSLPRIMVLAWLYVAHSESVVAQATLSKFVAGYQTGEKLKIGELWALPSALRYVLIENLRRVSMQIQRLRQMRLRANQLADKIFDFPDDSSGLDLLLRSYVADAENDGFAAQLLYRLRDGATGAGRALSWLEERLEGRGSDFEEVLVIEQNRLSSGNATIGNIVRSLRHIDDIEWTLWVERNSAVDAILLAHTNFGELDFRTRDSYRDRIETLARRSGHSETEAAETAVTMTVATSEHRDVGFYLVGSHQTELEQQLGYKHSWRERVYSWYSGLGSLGVIVPVVVATVLAVALGWLILSTVVVSTLLLAILLVLASFPAMEAANGLFHWLTSFLVTPRRFAGYEWKGGIPSEARTLLAVPCLLIDRDSIDELVRNLEVHYLSNAQGEIYFALVSDFTDAQTEVRAEDADLVAYARIRIDALATKYSRDGGRRFFFLHRSRQFNASEDAWIGWERKRGKLHELNLLLRGDSDTSFLPLEHPLPDNIRYVMTLDADTRLTRDAVTHLVGKMQHPVNRPQTDPETGLVIAGHAIFQPRVTPPLTTGADASLFQRIFTTNRGLDPYVFTVSDTYQDLFDEGTFTGKGLYDVDAFEGAIAGRIAENTVLSHDLLEGAFARAGLVTDVELVEDFPTRYEVEVSRQHRWVRGDWQLLPFILRPGSKLGSLGRFKMLDNLRRSLTPVFWVIASVTGWCTLPVDVAWLWQAALVLSLFVAPTLVLVRDIVPAADDLVGKVHFSSLGTDVLKATAQVFLRITLIAHYAVLMVDAISRSLYRLFVSRLHLLEWRTAAQAGQDASGTLLSYFRMMWSSSVVGIGSVLLVILFGGSLFSPVLLLAAAWIVAPSVAWLVSRTLETEDRLVIGDADRSILRRIARRTWRYFETFVTKEHNFLPPDNVQQDPFETVAHRTSPTNIGLYLLSAISARDFGWISFADAIDRIDQCLTTVERMEKYEGHLFNWYDTRSLEPLHPLYVSAVDSGNLAGHLIAVAATCREWAQAPAMHSETNVDGVLDVLGIVREHFDELPPGWRALVPVRSRLRERLDGLGRIAQSMLVDPGSADLRSADLLTLAKDIAHLAADLLAEQDVEETREFAVWCDALLHSCEHRNLNREATVQGSQAIAERLTALGERARALAFATDFKFLYNRDRRLLSIGFRPESQELDESCYDLLASEARLTSLFAIAKGDLPMEHWFRLGRPVVPVGASAALLSWSGSMFEYLMPPLVMNERLGGILNATNKLIIRRQISYGNLRGIPWGISESAYNARDQNLTYQYSNFGVPSLGLKRGLSRDAVIAPYATILASQYYPVTSVRNLERLRKLGALGRYGYFDAVDYTPSRVRAGKDYEIVGNFMAHHHGMSIVALNNVVYQGRMRRRFHSDPVIEAAELLLQEKAPREISRLSAKDDSRPREQAATELRMAAVRRVDDPLHSDRETNMLSNGHFSSILTATGAGGSRWNDLAVTRWSPDPTEDRFGTFLFLRDMADGQWWSATAEPRQAAGERTSAVFSDDKVEFHKRVGTLRTEVQCIIATEADAEARKITLHNDGDEDRIIEVTSYCEIVLTSDDADKAHPLFSKMFVRTEISPRGNVIYAWRNKRQPGEPDMELAHLVTEAGENLRPTEAETDRRKFIGRGRTLDRAVAFDPGEQLSGSDGYTLDPVFALRRTVRIPAGRKTSLIFWTIAAPTRGDIEHAVERYSHAETFVHELQLSWTRSQVQLFYIGISSEDAAAFQKISRFLLYPDASLRGQKEIVHKGLKRQSVLWELSISGDFPIFLLRIDDVVDLGIVRRALMMQEYLRAHGLYSDLVIVNERSSSYAQDLQQALDIFCENARTRGAAGGLRQHIFAVRRDLMSTNIYDALMAAAAIVMHTRNGDIAVQLERGLLRADMREKPRIAHAPRELPVKSPPAPAKIGTDLLFWNGFGGFDEDNHYVVRLNAREATPHPWINVIANEQFGFHVSSEGAGFTWSHNSRDYQLTPWTNDPVINRPGEAFYIADLENGGVSTPMAMLSSDRHAQFEAKHAPGWSRFKSSDPRLHVKLDQTIAADLPVKISRLSITNRRAEPVKLRVYGYVEWVLGNNLVKTRPFVMSSWHDKAGALLANNPYSADYSERTAFFTTDVRAASHTADRREFLGQSDGSVYRPESVYSGAELSGNIDITGDPCAALAVDIALEPGETRAVTFYLGDGEDSDAANALIQSVARIDYDTASAATSDEWRDFLDCIQVETPDASFDVMVNTWLPYQNLVCRLKARSAFYQASGAFGFRDQLQDSLALLLHDPSIARDQIINAASRQFRQGDVQHWWLPGSGAGVRTMISDDVVWLGYGIAHYVEVSGETDILDVQLPFLEGPELEAGQHDNFFQPERSDVEASVYEHAALALDLAVRRTGKDGLPLILGGDWNDGMNRVGQHGEGQSVWLGWFLLKTLRSWIALAGARGDNERVERWTAHTKTLKNALEDEGWDGGWYRRATYDDGTPLGSGSSDEARIDSLPQSWSVLSGEGRLSRQTMALDAVMDKLVDEQADIIRLFTPPFENTPRDPGYIKGYPPGVRENGGQYTHAATWVVYALAEAGRADDAWRCFQLLNPVNHALDPEAAETYRVEPYVVAADIYGSGEKTGRGGWTWYTGSAGWLYRAAIEAVLGIRKAGNQLTITPAIPSHWQGFDVRLKLNGNDLKITVKRLQDGGFEVRVNDIAIDGPITLAGNESDI